MADEKPAAYTDYILTFGDVRIEPLKGPTPEQLARERREERALGKLWTEALQGLRVRHPDSRVRVDVAIKPRSRGSVRIEFAMHGLRDTGNETIFETPFLHAGFPEGWPGRVVAQKYIGALWALYTLHEGMELVTLRGSRQDYLTFKGTDFGPARVASAVREIPVNDPHETNIEHQRIIANTHNIALVLDIVMGAGKGAALVEREAAWAKRDLEREIRHLEAMESFSLAPPLDWSTAK